MRFRPLPLVVLFCASCSRCGAPSTTSQEDDPLDRDAAPHAVEAKSRCEVRSKIALPGTLELGRARNAGARVVIGARRGGRAGIVEIDGLTARFTETSEALGDLPPPLPIVSGEKIFVLGYEGKPRHLVLRDLAKPTDVIAALPPDPPDESLAFDAALRIDGSIAIAWDAPAEEGSAVWASIVRNGKPDPAVRLSPHDVDADAPRLVPLGPTILATWIAHRALPDAGASTALEGPGQDLDHAWIELLAFDDTLHATSPLRHLTPDGGRVTTFDAIPRGGNEVDIVARDGLELQAGQGGTALLAHVAGPDLQPSIVLSDHVGRGVPLYAKGMTLFDDTADRGRAVTDGTASPEPALDAARPLAVLGDDVLVAAEGGTELRVVSCHK